MTAAPIVDTYPSPYGPTLLLQHAKLLADSAISVEVAQARKYTSVERKARLEQYGFSRSQRLVPTLLIPIYDAFGEHALYQHRPDEPRIRDGKRLKYETCFGSKLVVDVPPLVRGDLRNPKLPLVITEGSRKADAGVSAGLCCISLLGVWGWRGTNDQGGKTALAEWEAIALNGRVVYLCFDSDVIRKREVFEALRRLKGFVENRGAEVWVTYLPSAEGGTKVGLDDFLASGHTPDELLALGQQELEPPPPSEYVSANPYFDTPGGLFWKRRTRDGEIVTPLTNFTARIVADFSEDDGIEVRRVFDLEAKLHNERRRFSVPAAQFPSLNWAIEQLGAGAIVYPGNGQRDHARAAIQFISDAPEHRTFTHTGWRQIDGEWVYLHANGAVGSGGTVSNVEVRLSDPLSRFALPEPPDGVELVGVVRKSLQFLEVAPDQITFPIYGAVFRAALGSTDFSLHIAGPTGAGKSELAALAEQHYGPTLDARHLPGSWSSTGNALEGLAFIAKDALLVVDDFCPAGGTAEVQRYHREADRFLRAQGNASGRQRMQSDGTLRPVKPPRGLVLSTGEDTPRGQSLRSRLFVLEVDPSMVNWERATVCQLDAAAGRYASVLAGFVRWLAPKYGDTQANLRAQVVELRAAATHNTAHRRTPEIVANLAVGLRTFLGFAEEVGAVTADEAATLIDRGWAALGQGALEQEQYQLTSEPGGLFLSLLRTAIARGGAHIASVDGTPPDLPGSWGWREKRDGSRSEWQPVGDRVGWLDGDDVYLDGSAAFAAAQSVGRDTGETLVITPHTLKRRLRDRGLLASVDRRNESKERLEVRRTLQGSRRTVLHILAGSLGVEKVSQVSQSACPQVAAPRSELGDGTLPWATSWDTLGSDRSEVSHDASQKSVPQRTQPEMQNGLSSSNGTRGTLSVGGEDPAADSLRGVLPTRGWELEV
jgi:hypothetical protein